MSEVSAPEKEGTRPLTASERIIGVQIGTIVFGAGLNQDVAIKAALKPGYNIVIYESEGYATIHTKQK